MNSEKIARKKVTCLYRKLGDKMPFVPALYFEIAALLDRHQYSSNIGSTLFVKPLTGMLNFEAVLP